MRTSSPRLAVIACAGLIGLLGGCSGATSTPTRSEAVPVQSAAAIMSAPATYAPTAIPSPTPATASRCGVATNASVAASATIHVTQDKLGFFDYDGPVTIKAGQSVTFVNGMTAAHTITEGYFGEKADDACVDAPLGTGATVTITFTKAGSFQFTCRPHPAMQTTIVVK
jgi:plastocyanin